MSYKERRSYLNCEKQIFTGVGNYDIPQLLPVDIDLDDKIELVPFNYALGEKNPENKIVHFYIDDYQFERVWNTPDRYINLLRKFKAVLSPDFSIYDDFPRAVNIFNHYRKHWLSAYWQMHGITVIPTICWGDENSFEWCLDGVPKNSVISTSSIGCFVSKSGAKDWREAYRKCVDILEPKAIILYGTKMREEAMLDDYNRKIPVILCKNSIIERLKKIKKVKKAEKGALDNEQ